MVGDVEPKGLLLPIEDTTPFVFYLEHSGPRVAHRVEGAALYERFDGALVKGFCFYSLAEVEEILERPALLPCLYDRLNTVVPDVLDRREAKPYGLSHHRKAVPALVYIRRQDFYSH